MANDTVQSRYDWKFSFGSENIIKNKEELVNSYMAYMLDRVLKFIKWKGLPDTIPQDELERITLINGKSFLVKDKKGDYYIVDGNFGGELNAYYFGRFAVLVNPWVSIDGTYELGKNAFVLRNDFMMVGIKPMFSKYANLLAETDISLRSACINSRIRKILIADNDKTKTDCDTYLRNIENGTGLATIGAKGFFEGLKVEGDNSSANNQIKELIELKQYLTSQWFIELGLNSNFNMKREAINSAESGMNDDILLPFIDQMLDERKKFCEEVNKTLGWNLSVELDSSWRQIHEEYHTHTEKGDEPNDNDNLEREEDKTESND